MTKGIRVSDLSRLNKGCGLKFGVGSWVQQETPEEGWRTHWPKHEYNNKDEDSSRKKIFELVEFPL